MVTRRLPEVNPLLRMSESQFTSLVVDAAKLYGWRVFHALPARSKNGWHTATQGHNGFPDLVLVKNGRVLFRELKVGRGKLTADQQLWRDAIGVDQWQLWTDKDLSAVLAELRS